MTSRAQPLGAVAATALGGPSSGDAVLTIGALDNPVTGMWTLPEGR